MSLSETVVHAGRNMPVNCVSTMPFGRKCFYILSLEFLSLVLNDVAPHSIPLIRCKTKKSEKTGCIRGAKKKTTRTQEVKLPKSQNNSCETLVQPAHKWSIRLRLRPEAEQQTVIKVTYCETLQRRHKTSMNPSAKMKGMIFMYRYLFISGLVIFSVCPMKKEELPCDSLKTYPNRAKHFKALNYMYI